MSREAVRMRWRHGTLIIGMTIVGAVEHSANGYWYAYGCMDDWQDRDLGPHEKEAEARRAVEDWAKEHLEP